MVYSYDFIYIIYTLNFLKIFCKNNNICEFALWTRLLAMNLRIGGKMN